MSININFNGTQWVGLGKTIFSIQGTSVNWNGYSFIATGVGMIHTAAFSSNGLVWVGLKNTIFSNIGNKVSSLTIGNTMAYSSDASLHLTG